MSHIHTWGRWGRVVLGWDSMRTTVITTNRAELVGVDRPLAPGWTRTCRTCRKEERS